MIEHPGTHYVDTDTQRLSAICKQLLPMDAMVLTVPVFVRTDG